MTRPPLNRIFLLSHMRANTSLIGHILGSHPEISGYLEMHQSYRSRNDLRLQQQRYSSTDTIKHSSRYLFDKILHDEYKFLPAQLDPDSTKILVSTRAAEPSIKSIIRLFSSKLEAHPYADPEQATAYYIQRITTLAEFCRQNKRGYYYLDAELIRTATDNSLKKLQQWLELSSPLTSQYQLFSQTGKPGAGDSSANISSGSIVEQQSNYDGIQLPAHFISAAESVLKRLKPVMLDNAIDSISCEVNRIGSEAISEKIV